MGVLVYFVRHSGCSAEGCAFIRFALGLVPVVLLLLTVGKGRLGKLSVTSIFSGLAISLCIFCYFKSTVALPIFHGHICEAAPVGGFPAVIPFVTGLPFLTARCEFFREEEAPFRDGFLVN